MKHLLSTLTILALGWTSLLGQGEVGTHFLQGTWQAQLTNPALVPEEKWVLALPDLYNNIYISSVTRRDLIGKDENGDAYLDAEAAIAQLDDENLLSNQLEYGTLGAGVNLGRFNLNLQHRIRYHAFGNYPKELAQVTWQGNAQFLGQWVEVGADVLVQGFHEVALGAAYRIGERLTLGGRIKWLSGIADASTERTQLAIFTDTTAYALEVDADVLVNSSGSVDYQGFRNLSVELDFGQFNLNRVFGRNDGYAVDLGARLDLGAVTLAASVLDLGQVRWKGDVSNLALQGLYSFEGLDIGEGILADSTEFGSVIDSLEAAFDVEETQEAYTTALGPAMYLSGSYQLDETWRFGALFYQQWWRGETFPTVGVAANARFWPFLELGATYAWRAGSFDNLGLNAVVAAGPVRIIASTDNILSTLQVSNSTNANVRLGVSLVF